MSDARQVTEEGHKIIQYRCQGCGHAQQVCAFPDSPRIAKTKCRICDRVNEVETRETFWDTNFEDHVGTQKDRKAVARRTTFDMKPTSITKKDGFTVTDRRRF